MQKSETGTKEERKRNKGVYGLLQEKRKGEKANFQFGHTQ